MQPEQLVPNDFLIPSPPPHAMFHFEPLGPEHNVADLNAWSISINHIHDTPGFSPDGWPERAYTLDENLQDLRTHRAHHEARVDFAWTVLDPAFPDTVIGCVYLKPDPSAQARAEARTWVRADCAQLDLTLREHLRPWFATQWPIPVRYA